MSDATNAQPSRDAAGTGAPPGGVAGVAERMFRTSRYQQLRGVQCEFRAGTLILHGQVPTFYLKQQAQIAVQNLEGVTRLDNRIEVL